MAEKLEIIAKSISIIHRAEDAYKNDRLASIGLNRGQLRYLWALYQEDGITQESLAKRFLTDKANVTRHMKRLKELDMVKCSVNPADKRTHRVFLTEKGQRIRPLIEDTTLCWNDFLTAGFTEQERNELLRLLLKMAENAADVMKREVINERTE
ncbi:MarR family winged helix-turn-helix transcriptional regulator [Listeria sp. PSOL-1]|uniref:MarR family winged helix-turn-helix transcriptional regulator n=1 Tax=Listeria sp. PSOL-1 TaxID=1844999 RepID=UPI0013D13952|nr:MarR family winged helix-turn-helix transcriptional regulator [Listeria sp. PSOL-1]